ncbi:hypothetical protein EMIT048CA2_60016 [Pseudomonas chlororaphis]
MVCAFGFSCAWPRFETTRPRAVAVGLFNLSGVSHGRGSMPRHKDVVFVGSALRDLRAFPLDARRAAGFQLDLLQQGEQPYDCRSMKTVGPGVFEIRISEDSGAFRVFYVANRPAAIYVLHAMRKTTRKTEARDIELARARLQEISARHDRSHAYRAFRQCLGRARRFAAGSRQYAPALQAHAGTGQDHQGLGRFAEGGRPAAQYHPAATQRRAQRQDQQVFPGCAGQSLRRRATGCRYQFQFVGSGTSGAGLIHTKSTSGC